MKRGARERKIKESRRGGKKEEEEGKKQGERQKRVGVRWREITGVFVVVCCPSPGYEPFIASPLEQGPRPLLTDR